MTTNLLKFRGFFSAFWPITVMLLFIFTNPSAQAGYDTRSIFKRSFWAHQSQLVSLTLSCFFCSLAIIVMKIMYNITPMKTNYIYVYILVFEHFHHYIYIYIYIYSKIGRSTKRFVFFEFIYLLILFLHTCMFPACCFCQKTYMA